MNQSELESKAMVAAATTTTSGNGTVIDLQPYINAGGRAMKAILNVGSATGTNPTLDVKMQECDTTNGTFTDITGAAFAQATAAGHQEIHFQAKKRYVKAVETVGGTTPVFGRAVTLLAQKRNV